MKYSVCKFELCPIDTGAIVLDGINITEGWRTAKKISKNRGYIESFNQKEVTKWQRKNIF